MLCLKGKIHRKILVTLIIQEDVIAQIKMYKILYITDYFIDTSEYTLDRLWIYHSRYRMKSKTLLLYMAQLITFLNIILVH